MRRLLCGLPACALAGFAVPVWADDSSTQYTLEIEQQPIVAALTEFSRQTGLQVGYLPESPEEENTIVAQLKGQYTVESALEEMLRLSGLGFERVNERTVAVGAVEAEERSKIVGDYAGVGRNRSEGALRWRLASLNLVGESNRGLDPTVPAEVSSAPKFAQRKHDTGDATRRQSVEEVVVTGTHIRGVTNSASPVQVYSRDQIDLAGLGSVKEFVLRLPQNFGGVASENAIGSAAGGTSASQNQVFGTGVNLRGLGPDATLVLVNGHRVAPSNTVGNWVDISLIPLAAVERVDVVPDGVSAIYGSDAVGGVVNFILNKDFKGAETRARYGVGDNGAPREFQIGQTIGGDWGGGSALLSYEYFDRDPLFARDRDYTKAAWEPFMLLPEQTRHGVFASVQQALSDRFELFADGTYAHKSPKNAATSPLGFSNGWGADIDAFSLNVGGHASFENDLAFELSSSYAASDTHQQIVSLRDHPFVPRIRAGTYITHRQVKTSILSADAKLDGVLWQIPAGHMRFALGAQYRRETLDSADLLTGGIFEPSRDLMAGFLELQVPLLGPASSSLATNRLELTLAARSERYSDFGSTTNPRLGLAWQPGGFGVKFRGTYGTSFKTPLLNDLDPAPGAAALQQNDPQTGAGTNVLAIYGGNPELDPEKATIWTAGMDFVPQDGTGLRANITYYDIQFKDRITDPSAAGFDLFGGALELESMLGPRLIQRNPPLSQILEILDSAAVFEDFTGVPGGVDLSTIGAIVDGRVHNLSRAYTSGIDVGLSYRAAKAANQIEFGIDGTYILKFEGQFLNAAAIELRNVPYQPIDLKLRGRAIVNLGDLIIAAFINYIDSYTDNRRAISVPVESWTTADAVVAYRFRADDGLFAGASAQLSVINLTNEKPPLLGGSSRTFPGINFDGTNANALGRSISVQLSKQW